MTPQPRRGWRPPGARHPGAFALSILGAVLLLLGLTVLDSVLLAVLGAVLTVAGWLVARRSS
ncbi:hypothetical protein [Micromonospora auratinigra]|uniref:Uncharacterized protein n=1 Tax=Micromonospora auratinigra TaxID=261654 RepID=A0A1A9A9N0_9ACTN|nr:hypothetical protein [Micromonospora auratinigra]SBT52835.1 hypothetical protein GA0070611_5817 [Micromonospora auratinigra]